MAEQENREIKILKKDQLPRAKLSWANLRRSLRLFEYLGRHKWKFILGMIFLTLSAGVGLIFPLKSGEMFGYLGESDKTADVIKVELFDIGLVLGLILLAQAVFSFGRVFFFAQVTESIISSLRKETFQRVVKMPMSFFSRNQVSELSSRIATDINVISEAFTVNIAEFIRQFIVGVGGLVLLVSTTKWDIAKWFLFIIPPLTAFAILFSRKIRRYSRKYQDKVAEANIAVGEAFTGITNVKTFTNETYEIRKYGKIADGIKEFGVRYGILRGLFFSFVMVFVFGSIFFILWQMLYALKVEHSISSEDFGTFMMLSLFVAGSLGGLPEQIASIQRALGATERVFELIDGPVEQITVGSLSEIKTAKGKIEFRDVSFSYPTRPEFTVLKKVSFFAEPGETVALVGSSGSGKSTIASLILRFYDPVSGCILIDGKESREIPLTELRSQIALVPQDVILFAGTIRDNIAYGRPEATEEEIKEAARQANAYTFIDSFPDKFDTLVGERGIQLSGGQRQRIAIARAVLKNPAILVLDEATSSLDSESEQLVQEALDKLMVGRTCVVIAHRLATIRNADRIVVLQHGVVEESGTHQQLISNDQGLYYKLSRLQFDLVS